MSDITRPIAVSTSLSILLHSAVVAAALLLVSEPMVTTGRGIEIDLVSSIEISEQQETTVAEVAESSVKKTDVVSNRDVEDKSRSSQKQLTMLDSETVVDVADDEAKARAEIEAPLVDEKLFDKAGDIESLVSQATNASQQHESIVDLLHASISEKKEYPYIARRQRREGVATIGFVLHPNGMIENTHLVLSSSTGALDRAALSAVKSIEPFHPANQYLEQAESFKVNVVFNLL